MLTEKMVDTGKLKINCAEGEKNGPPLFMLHGVTQHWQSLRFFYPSLSQKFHLYAPDLRGHGKSDRAAAYRMVDYVEDIVDFLTQQIDEPTVIVGYSLGGLASLGLSSHVPEKIRALVLIDPPLINRDSGFDAMSYSFAHSWILMTHTINTKQQDIDEIVPQLQQIFPEAGEAVWLANARMIRSVDIGVTTAVIENWAVEGFSLSSDLQAITCPVLLLHGEQKLGSLVRDTDVAFFQTHVPHSQLVEVKGWGHDLVWPPASDVCLDHMNEFLDTL
ncbi:alpha/beta fold hydrolase [Candidatus Leptofilum sp.]|uniref:alpha/beta fold hydrolase n=1 Tax=Candidatus Leptofilum sp. TaxID=3241576 RepID=UPI003B5B4CFA